MKRYIYYIWCLLGLGLLTGCMFEEESIETKDENLVHMVFTAMVEDGSLATKTVLDENDVDGFRDVLWEPEDVIGVSTYNGRYQRFENVLEEPAASGVFEGYVNQDIMYYAIYPYRDNQQMSSSVNVTIPSKQTYKPNSFDGSAAPMVGKGNHAEPLHFMNLCGSLAINITGTAKIKSIVFETKAGEKVSGDATVDPDYADYPILTMSETADTYIVLDCGEGVQLSGDPASFHFVLPPATYKGFKITIATVDGQFMEKSTDKQLNIKRSIVTKAASFAFENNVKDFTDLSERGNANSYIVSQSGNYSFDATVIGNGEFGFTPDHNFHTNSPEISPLYVDVLWEDSLGLIKGCGYDSTSGEAKFITSGKEGNAVLAAKDADGTIIWSWHIWMTDQPEEQVYNNDAGIMMDRNLGAISATPGDVSALGLLYQWGRKDPFLGSAKITSSQELTTSTIVWPAAVQADVSVGTIAYSVMNPTTFIKNNGTNHDWYYTGTTSTDNTRWQPAKTIYDPCPSGWRVPDGGKEGIWAIALGLSSQASGYLYDSNTQSLDLSGKLSDVATVLYPAAGYRTSNHGSLYAVADRGYCWSVTPYNNEAYSFDFYDSGTIHPAYSTYRAYGFSVRCMKDDGYVDISYPQVSITGFEQISTTSESLKANVKAEGISSVTERGFIYGQMPDLSDGIKVQCGSGLGEFLYTLTGLTKATKYYVAAYAINSRGEIHSPIKSFTTKFSDVVVDLSSNETANCYVVHELGIYSFDCTVKGNSLESVGSPVSVDVLWEIDNTNESTIVGDIICDVILSQDNSIVFNATGKEGNALIAVKDIEGNILWSWHIWVTDQPQELHYVNSKGEFYLLDRNLGATKADGGAGEEWKESVGALYQWGRKDPLIVDIYKTNHNIKTVEESILHPTEHASLSSWNYTSHWEKNHNNDLWNPDHKTIYDPCPSGYMVADNSAYYGNSIDSELNNGYYIPFSDSANSWFPITPIIWCGGNLIEASNEIIVWSSRKTNDNSFHRLHVKSESLSSYWDGYDNAAMASPVRCMKDESSYYKYDNDFSTSGAISLSDAGTANTYIVSSSGTYSFPTVKGNKSESVGSVAFAEVLWETFGTDEKVFRGSLVSGTKYENGKVYFKTADSYREGNAVIVAKDASRTILWSWHIWLTDEPQGQVYYNNAGTMMDRNLGATSATPGDVGALGLLYQWGRKDPFLGSSSISSNTMAKSTLTWPSAVSSDSSNGTIAYAVEHPTTFITYNSNNYDWHYTGSSSTDNTRWQSEKTIYDPCPAGWRVPDGGSNGVWNVAGFSGTTYDDTNKGISFSISSPSTTWYPASGYRSSYDGALYGVGEGGGNWSVTPNGGFAYSLYFFNGGPVDPTYDTNPPYGFSVRCVQESK